MTDPKAPKDTAIERPRKHVHAPKGPLKGKGAAPVTRRKEALKRLEGELAALGSDLDLILDQLRIKLHGRLATLQERVAGKGEAPAVLTLAAAEKALAHLSGLKVRPPKGRLKDLHRVADLLDALRKGLLR